MIRMALEVFKCTSLLIGAVLYAVQQGTEAQRSQSIAHSRDAELMNVLTNPIIQLARSSTNHCGVCCILL